MLKFQDIQDELTQDQQDCFLEFFSDSNAWDYTTRLIDIKRALDSVIRDNEEGV